MKKIPDVDIDVVSTIDRTLFGVRAINYDESTQRILQHNSGIYFKNSGIPVDKETGNAAISFDEAQTLGFMKVDLLSNTVYDGFTSKKEVLDAFNAPTDWEKLENADYVAKLPHLYNHVDIVLELHPQSLEDLADVLALIRPGKKHLLLDYKQDKGRTRDRLYVKTDEAVYFKKSHAYAYAAMLICYMNKKEAAHLVVF